MENKQLSSILPTFSQKNGETAYVVSAHFSGTSTEIFEIPNSVSTIGERAFYGCDNLVLTIEDEGSYAHKYAQKNKIKYVLE